MKRLSDLIFVSLENWDEIWRRNQFVCAELSQRSHTRKILFVGPARDVWNDFRHVHLREIKRKSTFVLPEFPNITVTYPLKLFPDSVGLGRRANAWMFRRHVRRIAKGLRFCRPVLWLNPHSAEHITNRMDASAVIYDITDDWTSVKQNASALKRTVRQDETLARKADAVIVCSHRLLEMKQCMARRLFLIENGVNAAHYAGVIQNGPIPEEAKGWNKPVFGYTGTVHPERVDVALVEAIAKQMTRGSMVFVGPDHLDQSDKTRLIATGRIRFVGAVAYEELPAYMRAIDVCVVPHRMTPFTESLNPIKLWEYLAAGKPIVATDVAGFRDYSHLVRIARTSDEFIAAMQSAEAEGLTRAEERRAVAREHSWQRRVDAIEAVIEELTRETSERGVDTSNGVCVA